MSTAKLWRTLRATWWILLIGAVVGGLAAAAAVLVMPRTYSSHADVMIQAESADAGGGTDLQLYISNRLPTWIALAVSDDNVSQVARTADTTPEEVAEQVTYSVPPATAVIAVSATGASPEASQALARAAADSLSARIAATSEAGVTVDPSIIVAAKPGTQTAPDPTIIVPGGVVAGVLVGFLLSLLQGARRLRPRTLEDISDAIEAPVLAVLDPQRRALFARAEVLGEPTSLAGLLGRLRASDRTTFLLVPLGSADPRALSSHLQTLPSSAGISADLRPTVEDGPSSELTGLGPDGAVVLLVGPLATTDRIARSARRARVHGAEIEGAVVVEAERSDATEDSVAVQDPTAAGSAAVAEPGVDEGTTSDAGRSDTARTGSAVDGSTPLAPRGPATFPATSSRPTTPAGPEEAPEPSPGAGAVAAVTAAQAQSAHTHRAATERGGAFIAPTEVVSPRISARRARRAAEAAKPASSFPAAASAGLFPAAAATYSSSSAQSPETADATATVPGTPEQDASSTPADGPEGDLAVAGPSTPSESPFADSTPTADTSSPAVADDQAEDTPVEDVQAEGNAAEDVPAEGTAAEATAADLTSDSAAPTGDATSDGSSAEDGTAPADLTSAVPEVDSPAPASTDDLTSWTGPASTDDRAAHPATATPAAALRPWAPADRPSGAEFREEEVTAEIPRYEEEVSRPDVPDATDRTSSARNDDAAAPTSVPEPHEPGHGLETPPATGRFPWEHASNPWEPLSSTTADADDEGRENADDPDAADDGPHGPHHTARSGHDVGWQSHPSRLPGRSPGRTAPTPTTLDTMKETRT
ncbi:hypothetical protein ACT3TZ_02520 [Brachybacterium sp. AOP25-B2-12]|uniref:hypothetical protein n=1 Tax=Brachybacterium sp. AOP25-B2-12 TaxID=3457710 RepID=UPI004033E0FA